MARGSGRDPFGAERLPMSAKPRHDRAGSREGCLRTGTRAIRARASASHRLRTHIPALLRRCSLAQGKYPVECKVPPMSRQRHSPSGPDRLRDAVARPIVTFGSGASQQSGVA